MIENVLNKVRGLYKISSSKTKKTPMVLVVLDGWGLAPAWGGNAIATADTPVFDELLREYPNCQLNASGEAVGLPAKTPGNSEAGHLNIGAGRIVHQDVSVINDKMKDENIAQNHAIMSAIEKSLEKKSSIHIMGLLSKTTTHSNINHIYPMLRLMKKKGQKKVYLHLFSDGRDSDPMSGLEMIVEVEHEIKRIGVGKVASIIGRYYAMDRDNHWGRTARAYNAMVKGEAETTESAKEVFSESYARGTTDEFIEPRIISNKKQQKHIISNNDSIILFNFRPDRIKQIVHCFTPAPIDRFSDRMKLKGIKFVSFSQCGERSCDAESAFPPDTVESPLAEVLSDKGYTQLHLAETEKYAHATYFLNGGNEKPHQNEKWKMIPSPKVRDYGRTPKMSAKKITTTAIKNIRKGKFDFVMINFANPDMVGHSGNLKAVIQAVSFIDQQIKSVLEVVQDFDGTLILSADHGNAEQMLHPNSATADTEHTTNPVPLIVVNKKLKDSISLKKNGNLSNITPTILDIMGIKKPNEMSTRESLIEESNGDRKKVVTTSVKRKGIFK